MRGYFGIGVERINKPMNLGTLMRTAHAFGADFLFTVEAKLNARRMRRSDTSHTTQQLPYYQFPDIESLILPTHCQLVGIEITDDAIALPTFHHPQCAAYILGPERDSLSPETQARCDHIVQIPTLFCLNLGMAGALVMYDRLISKGRFAERALMNGGPTEAERPHRFGQPKGWENHTAPSPKPRFQRSNVNG